MTGGGVPVFAGPATTSAGSTTLTVHYSEPIDCTTVQAADYEIQVLTGPGAEMGPLTVLPSSATCVSPTAGASDTVALGLGSGSFQTGQSGTARMVGEVKDKAGTAEPSNDTTLWSVSG